jgi:hypothetical protein
MDCIGIDEKISPASLRDHNSSFPSYLTANADESLTTLSCPDPHGDLSVFRKEYGPYSDTISLMKGVITSVQGDVVEIEFSGGLPSIKYLLVVQKHGGQNLIPGVHDHMEPGCGIFVR